MMLAHRVLLRPNKTQRAYFARAAGTARFAYNWALARWKELYAAGEKPSAYGLVKEFNAMKGAAYPWTAEVTKWAPQKAIQDLGDAYANFFKENAERPHCKKKGACKDSFYFCGKRDFAVDGNRLRVPKLGWVRMKRPCRFPGVIKSVVISREGNRWFASLQVDVDESWVYPHQCENQAAVGVDLGLIDLAVLSTGERLAPPKAYRRAERKLARLQRAVSRKQKGSSNRRKAVERMAKAHRRVRDVRNEAAHAFTARLVRDFRYIGIEDLHVKGMMKNHHLAKSIGDASWGELRRQLTYKSVLAWGHVVVADRWYPSSQLCSACGERGAKLSLDVRSWQCACGAVHDRDINAAKNLEIVALGLRETQNACGEDVRPMPPLAAEADLCEAGTG